MRTEKTRPNPPPKATHGFIKGRSGNPGGRPKGEFSLTAGVKERLRLDPDLRQKLVDTVFEMLQRKPEVLVHLWERLDGRIPQGITGGVGTIQVLVVYSADVGRSIPVPTIEIEGGGVVAPTALIPAPTATPTD